jgi:hypothetical protein
MVRNGESREGRKQETGIPSVNPPLQGRVGGRRQPSVRPQADLVLQRCDPRAVRGPSRRSDATEELESPTDGRNSGMLRTSQRGAINHPHFGTDWVGIGSNVRCEPEQSFTGFLALSCLSEPPQRQADDGELDSWNPARHPPAAKNFAESDSAAIRLSLFRRPDRRSFPGSEAARNEPRSELRSTDAMFLPRICRPRGFRAEQGRAAAVKRDVGNPRSVPNPCGLLPDADPFTVVPPITVAWGNAPGGMINRCVWPRAIFTRRYQSRTYRSSYSMP